MASVKFHYIRVNISVEFSAVLPKYVLPLTEIH